MILASETTERGRVSFLHELCLARLRGWVTRAAARGTMAKAAKKKSTTPRVGDRPFLQVELRAFAHATEDPRKVEDALAFAAGFDRDNEKDAKGFDAALTTMPSQGHFRNPIVIMTLLLGRAAQVRRFWDRLLAEPAVQRLLAAQAHSRLDDELVFWFRLDKQAAAKGALRLAEGEDVLLVRAKLATYPKDRETGLSFLDRFFAAERPRKML